MTKFVVMASWDDVPHLTQKQKSELWSSIPPFQRDARSKGIPQLGSGAIYPVLESEISCEPFELPRYWPRCYALDVGWNRTAVIWGAHDPENDVVYLYGEHYRAHAEPSVHAQAIRARGDWIPGVIDPAARGRSQIDGGRLIEQYMNLDLLLMPADNSVEAGILAVWERLSGGRLKVFSGLQNFFTEFRLYRRDEKGKIVKTNDHLMDCARYLIMSGLPLACVQPSAHLGSEQEWMSDSTRSSVTGY